MKYFFESEENVGKLRHEVVTWIPTPFRHMAGVKNAGADCIGFLGEVLKNVGAIENPRKLFPKHYGHDWCHHTSEQKIYWRMKRSKYFAECTPLMLKDDISNGDIILYQFGKAASHCAIYLDGFIWQCINFMGVNRISFKDNLWYKRRRFAFRVKNV